jgi:hypothetical protein
MLSPIFLSTAAKPFPIPSNFFLAIGLFYYYCKKKMQLCWALAFHACYPSYLRDRDQEDCDLRPAQAKSETLFQIYPTPKRTGRVSEAAEKLPSKFKLQYFQQQKNVVMITSCVTSCQA